jgi:ribose transport system permease protein
MIQIVVGVQIYAIGGNREAARLSGIKVNLVRLFSSILSG